MSNRHSRQNGTSTSLTLIEQVRQSDSESWNRLVQLYRPLVAYWCYRWEVNSTDVDDLIQEVFSVVASKVKDVRHELRGDSFGDWMRGIMLNKLREYSRSRRDSARESGGAKTFLDFQLLPDTEQAKIMIEPPEQVSEFYLRAIDLFEKKITPRTWHLF